MLIGGLQCDDAISAVLLQVRLSATANILHTTHVQSKCHHLVCYNVHNVLLQCYIGTVMTDPFDAYNYLLTNKLYC